MKRSTLTLIIAVFCTCCTFAQTRKQQFLKKLDSYEALKRETLYSGRYKDAITPLTDLITLVDTTTIHQAEDGFAKSLLIEAKSNYQYDLACCYALSGQKEQALEALEQSIANGYNNYNHLISDSDLQSLHKDKKFQKLVQMVKANTKLEILRRSNAYDFTDKAEVPPFEYQSADDKNLQRVREYFQLDTIPGKDDELTHIKNLLHFAHDNIRHNGSNMAICEFDAIDIYNYNRATGQGVNCRQLAISLCEMYLAMGYKARVVTCLPADPNDYECHVINTVYSETLQKWLYIDPTMDAWVMDENGTMLSIAEVRERLINRLKQEFLQDQILSKNTYEYKESMLDIVKTSFNDPKFALYRTQYAQHEQSVRYMHNYMKRFLPAARRLWNKEITDDEFWAEVNMK